MHFIEQDLDGYFVARTFLQVREIAAFCDEETFETSSKDEYKMLDDNFKNQIELYKESIEKCINEIDKSDQHLVKKNKLCYK